MTFNELTALTDEGDDKRVENDFVRENCEITPGLMLLRILLVTLSVPV